MQSAAVTGCQSSLARRNYTTKTAQQSPSCSQKLSHQVLQNRWRAVRTERRIGRSQRAVGLSRWQSSCWPLAASNRDVDQDEERKEQLVEGFSVDSPDIWEGEGFGIAFKVGFISLCVGATVLMLSLASPVINNTIAAFPVR